MPATSALITVAELNEQLGAVVILDVQYTLDGEGPDRYATAHLPGAPHLDLDAVLADPAGVHGRHPLPSAERLQAGLRAVGLDDDAIDVSTGPTAGATRVVVYDQGPALGAARAWWVLRWAGLTNVRVLHGGLTAWQRAGLPTTTEGPTIAPGTITIRPGAVPVLAADDVLPHLARGGMLLDARTAERFRGEVEPIDTEAGHIPGATSLPIGSVLTADGTFAAPEVTRRVLAEHGIPTGTGDHPTVATSCGSGITACQLTLALHEAGIASKPYIGSWSEWITDPARPRATGAA